MVKALSREPSLDISAIVLNPGRLVERLEGIGIRVNVLDESIHNFLSLRRKAIAILKNEGIDIFHSHRYKENILAGSIARKCGVRRLVQTVHGVIELEKGIALYKSRIYGWANRLYTRRYFDKIIAVSDDIGRRLKTTLPPSRLIIIHNAIEPESVRPKKTSDEIRRDFNIDSSAPIIGATGRMVPVKGYDIFLQSAKQILEKRPDARFMLIGDGPLKADLMKLAERLEIADRVFIPGFRDDIIELVNAFDIYVISSHHEGVPMALLEALSLGKAVVSTAVGGVNEVIRDGESGLLVEPGSADALADGCLELLADPVKRSTLEKGARARIENEFNTEIQSGKMLDLYRELVA